MKASSRQFIVARGARPCHTSLHAWEQVTVLECLGHSISDNGRVKPDWDRTVCKLLRSFWANVAHRSLRNTEMDRNLQLLDRCCRPQLDFRNTRWPPTKELCSKQNALQRKLISILQGTRPDAEEDVHTFCDRRRRLAAAAARRRGLWAQRHVDRCLAWKQHLLAERNKASWPATLLCVEDEVYLETLRALRPAGTGTRIRQGPPHARWSETVAKHD